ncbi:MAG: HD domain-containing protein [Proteobacteria bacterium]|nr:HD domain-containing protein [Pseudomonadota bacterium]MBK7116220.1 HD domain-containing protein [Pseudomonadota bacterium]MBK9252328.1 HD domain-containing protein [Pseudomonadota bacterium]
MKANNLQYSARRSDYDVTNTVRVSSAADVRDAVQELLESAWPGLPFAPVARAFHDFEMAFTGRMPGYFGVDTVYHDQQHTLDVTLAMARLMVGYERSYVGTDMALGAERAAVGIFLALFHDIGYLRERTEEAQNGAEFTRNHVTRSARFMDFYLPTIGFAHWTRLTSEIVHFTGYEKTFEQIGEKLKDPRDIKLGHLLGTADMIAQMADRCYLEKCRDRLYPEFVLGGVAVSVDATGSRGVRYASGLDLLRQTPGFMEDVRRKRLDAAFDRAYRYLEPLFGGRNPYIESIDQSLVFLRQVLRSESWRMLRRSPQVFAAEPDSLTSVRGLMASYFKRAWSK